MKAERSERPVVCFGETLWDMLPGAKLPGSPVNVAFLPAIISKLIDRAPPAKIIGFASRPGAYVASQEGGCPRYTLYTINQTNFYKMLFTTKQNS